MTFLVLRTLAVSVWLTYNGAHMTSADPAEKARLKADSKRYGPKRALQRQRDRLYGARAESQACQDIAREFVNVAKRRGFKASVSQHTIG